eukprot:2810752-Amphidinium_carterae.2
MPSAVCGVHAQVGMNLPRTILHLALKLRRFKHSRTPTNRFMRPFLVCAISADRRLGLLGNVVLARRRAQSGRQHGHAASS